MTSGLFWLQFLVLQTEHLDMASRLAVLVLFAAAFTSLYSRRTDFGVLTSPERREYGPLTKDVDADPRETGEQNGNAS